jgi:hypothetical protein
MNARTKVVLGAIIAAVAALGVTAGVLLAQPDSTQTPPPGGANTHAQMHQMMDAMHGAGTSDRMHEAMGADAERMIDQCVAMMSMMSGMMGGQNGRSMQDMMDRMIGR